MSGGVDDPGQSGQSGHWGGVVDDGGGMMNSRINGRSSRINRRSSSNNSLMMMNHWSSRPEDGWGMDSSMVDNWGSMHKSRRQHGVGRGVGHAPNNGHLPLPSGEDVSLSMSNLGSLDLGGVNRPHDGGGGGHGEGVAGHPVSIVIGPVMGGQGDALGGDVGEGPGHTPSSVAHGGVGLSSLAVAPGGLSQHVLGVVLGFGGAHDDGSSSSNDLVMMRGSSNDVRVPELGVGPRVPGGDDPLGGGAGDDAEEDDGSHFVQCSFCSSLQ